MTGAVSTRYNYEYAPLIFDGQMGLVYGEEQRAVINVTKVKEAWELLKAGNRVLQDYSTPSIQQQMVNFFVKDEQMAAARLCIAIQICCVSAFLGSLQMAKRFGSLARMKRH
ncbi:hypothetical protein BDB00DRAFT_880501 [Zychaea mexicana]|uniref:uncharacterized protein n=1 Tax=Zychaea mexicana TaxID=64656 RepID=UPI0022FE584D|nr:uncharacterized protein BDB00DRAFT_880501 [Zychaea mexicana]KAI9467613.1 hypothetical protein BDB00DRAFT_880501 [Zychaea mexicana]